MEKQDNIEAMQLFLRKEIIDAGYSAENFLQFLTTQKTSGQDIENWNYDQLILTVQKYKQRQSAEIDQTSDLKMIKQHSEKIKEQQKNDLLSKFEVFGQQELMELAIQNKEKVLYENTNLYDLPLHKTVICLKNKGFNENMSKGTIDVTDYEIKITGGLFFGIGKKKQLWFTINSSNTKSTVKRSDDDFIWLRTNLIRLNPGYLIPPYPLIQDLQKQGKVGLQNQKQFANLFLRTLKQNQFIFNSKLVVSFLTWGQYNKFTQLKTTYNSITYPITIQNLQTTSGQVDIEISKKNISILTCQQNLSTKLQGNFQKINQQIKNVSEQFNKTALSLYSLGTVFKQQQQSYLKFYNTVPECKNNSILSAIIQITNSLYEWARLFQQNKNNLLNSMQRILKFNKMQMQATNEMIQRRNLWKNQYLKFKDNLIKKKQKVILEPSKWELPQHQKYSKMQKNQLMKCILPKQSSSEEKMKVWLAYVNKQTQTQVQRVLFLNTKRLAEHWTDFCIQALKSTNDAQLIFKNISNGSMLNIQRPKSMYQ